MFSNDTSLVITISNSTQSTLSNLHPGFHRYHKTYARSFLSATLDMHPSYILTRTLQDDKTFFAQLQCSINCLTHSMLQKRDLSIMNYWILVNGYIISSTFCV